MTMTQILQTAIGGLMVGYLTFRLILLVLPRRLKAGNYQQRLEVLKHARKQAEGIKADSESRAEQNVQLLREEMEENLKARHEDLKAAEHDLEAREQSLQTEENRVKKNERDLETITARVAEVKGVADAKGADFAAIQADLRKVLETTAKADAHALKSSMRDSLIEARQLECQKVLRIHQDDLQTSARRLAYRTMSRAMARYAPEFPWPKAINHVELLDPKLVDALNSDTQTLIPDMKQKAGIEIELLISDKGAPPILKLGGGAGVDREAARLALDELIKKGPSSWAKSAVVYDKYRASLEQEAIKLGRQAVRHLRLDEVHPEVQKLVGYLNWRTSYRQNQYLHSVEVSVLAGIVASELGVDPSEAKRCGLLHDIGKAIDYRIEGSHAVISGDYADRFGENRYICDALMSHHNDLVVETPLAYVLKTADTLSGARPGARVNLEEGYQVRLSAIDDVVRSFPGVLRSAIMNGGREVHIEVNHKRVQEEDLQSLSTAIAKRIEKEVAFPGQIKVLVTRRFEATAVA